MLEHQLFEILNNHFSSDQEFYGAMNEFLAFKDEYIGNKAVLSILSDPYIVERVSNLYHSLADKNAEKRVNRVYSTYCKSVMVIEDGLIKFFDVDSVDFVSQTLDVHRKNGRKVEKRTITFNEARAADSIRFVDTHFNNLFYMVSLGYVAIDNLRYRCMYIDPTHLDLNGYVYHITELAEKLKGSKKDKPKVIKSVLP